MGASWDQAAATLAKGGLSVCVDPSRGGVAALMRSADVEMLQRFRNFLLAISEIARDPDAAPRRKGEYRGFPTHAIGGQLRIALLDEWLLVTNSTELGKTIVDNYVDRSGGTLAGNKRFTDAMSDPSRFGTSADLVGYLDVAAIREAGTANELFSGRTDDPAVEVLIGGIVSNLRETADLTAGLELTADRLRFRASMPHQRGWEASREYFFGENSSAAAPPLIDIPDRLFAMSAHRDLSQMWLRAGDLLTVDASDELAKADAQLTTLFAGQDFGEDILAALGSEVQFVARPQDFSGRLPRPAIQIPEFAFRFRLEDAEKTRPELRRVFQSFVGFLNVVGAMDGQPQFDLGSESTDNGMLYTATYVPRADERESLDARVNYNFSPTLGFAEDRFVLSSTADLARALTESTTRTADSSAADSSVNTAIRLNAAPLEQVLTANMEQLVAQNMLEKGHDKEAAEAEIGGLLELIRLFGTASAKLRATDGQLQLTGEVGFNE